MRGITRSVITIAGRKRGDLLERFLAVARRLGDEAPAPDELFEPDARGRIVFDDQHALGDASPAVPLVGFQPCHFYILGANLMGASQTCKLNRK